MYRNKKNNKGFTLIELLVVIAVVGLLASLILVYLQKARSKGRDALRAGNLKQLQSAIELFFADNNFYPSTNLSWSCWDCSNAYGSADVDIFNPYTGAKIFETIKEPLLPYTTSEIKDVYSRPVTGPDAWLNDERGYWYKSNGIDFKVGSYINPENMEYYTGLFVDTAWCTPDPSHPSGCADNYTGVGFWTDGAKNW